MKISKKKRVFAVGSGKNLLKIKHVADIKLNDDEQITIKYQKSNYDFVKKNWGFYATPSINYRLKKEGFKTALVKNLQNRVYLMVVHKKKMLIFKKYCKYHKQKIVQWLDNF